MLLVFPGLHPGPSCYEGRFCENYCIMSTSTLRTKNKTENGKNDKNEIKRSYAIWPYGHPGCDHPGGVVPFFIGKKILECESPPHLGVQTVPLTLDFEI